MVAYGSLLPMVSPQGVQSPTHPLYADDVLLLCLGTDHNLGVIVDVFNLYGCISGQLINWEKSNISFG